jgi:aerobic carbon-monoxide dehydrogenase large subunit
MSKQPNDTQLADGEALRFGSGHRTIRSEDGPLLAGRGKFTDDLDVAGQVHAAFVRTTVPHAFIRKVDTTSAVKMPGVIAAITGRDLAADDIGDIPPVASFNGRDGKPMFQATMPVLATERVRYVGEAVAVVIAVTADQALAAAEVVEVELDSLSAAPNVERAMAKDAQTIWPGAPNNIALDWEDGDAAASA